LIPKDVDDSTLGNFRRNSGENLALDIETVDFL
jgi:hypothetical protein